jgi:hypothetical protein
MSNGMKSAQDVLTATAGIAIEVFTELEKARAQGNTPGQMLSHLLRARHGIDRLIVHAERATSHKDPQHA